MKNNLLKKETKNKVDKNFNEIIKILNKNKLKYWVCHGTLLGIVRDKNLIPWDHDIDIALWKSKKTIKKIKTIMRNNNFILNKKYFKDDGLYTFIKKGGRRVDINLYEKKHPKYKNLAFVYWYLPSNNFFKLINALSESKYYSGKYSNIINKLRLLAPCFIIIKNFFIYFNLFYKKTGYTMPIKYLRFFKKIKFKGISINVPKYPERSLEFTYGNEWKTKIKNFNWVQDSPSTKDF